MTASTTTRPRRRRAAACRGRRTEGCGESSPEPPSGRGSSPPGAWSAPPVRPWAASWLLAAASSRRSSDLSSAERGAKSVSALALRSSARRATSSRPCGSPPRERNGDRQGPCGGSRVRRLRGHRHPGGGRAGNDLQTLGQVAHAHGSPAATSTRSARAWANVSPKGASSFRSFLRSRQEARVRSSARSTSLARNPPPACPSPDIPPLESPTRSRQHVARLCEHIFTILTGYELSLLVWRRQVWPATRKIAFRDARHWCSWVAYRGDVIRPAKRGRRARVMTMSMVAISLWQPKVSGLMLQLGERTSRMLVMLPTAIDTA